MKARRLKKATKFVIDVKTWLRGSKNSFLQAPDDTNAKGKRCCLGFYLMACGATEEEIKGYLRPEDVSNKVLAPAWLLNKKGLVGPESSEDAKELMRFNDASGPTDKRIAHIRKLFKKNGITPTFRNVK